MFTRQNKENWSAALTVSVSNKILCCRFRSETCVKKTLKRKNVVAFGMYTADWWGHGDKETRGHGDIGTLGHGDKETRGHGDIGTWGHGDKELQNVGERESDSRCILPGRVKEKLNSEQYKRYNLSRGHLCGRAVNETAVRTAPVYI